MSSVFYLLRHSIPELVFKNGVRVMYGPDVLLSQAGREKAAALAEHILAREGRPLDALYSSPYRRALETAQILAGRMGLGEVSISPNLHDTDHRWAGVPFDELLQISNAGRTFADPRTLETLPDLAKRMAAAFSEIAQAHPGGRVGVLSHGDPLRALYHHLLHPGEPLPAYPELCRLVSLETAEGLRVEIDEAGRVEKIEPFK